MTGPEGIIPKPQTLSEIIKGLPPISNLDGGSFMPQPDTVIKKHSSSGTHQGLNLDYNSLTFAAVLSSEQMMTYTEMFEQMFEQIFGESEEQRLNREMAKAASQLPGAGQMVMCPGCLEMRLPIRPHELHNVIVHLNDRHRWGRNKIADWLDELADSGQINIDFPTPQLKENE